MHDILDFVVCQHAPHGSHIDASRCQERDADCAPEFLYKIIDTQPRHIEDHATHQTKTIGMQAAGRHTQDDITGSNGRAIDQVLAIDDAYAKTGQVIIAMRSRDRA